MINYKKGHKATLSVFADLLVYEFMSGLVSFFIRYNSLSNRN